MLFLGLHIVVSKLHARRCEVAYHFDNLLTYSYEVFVHLVVKETGCQVSFIVVKPATVVTKLPNVIVFFSGATKLLRRVTKLLHQAPKLLHKKYSRNIGKCDLVLHISWRGLQK